MNLLSTLRLKKRPSRWLRRIGSSRILSRLLGYTSILTLLRVLRRLSRNLYSGEQYVFFLKEHSPAEFFLLVRRIERLRRTGLRSQVISMPLEETPSLYQPIHCPHPSQPVASMHLLKECEDVETISVFPHHVSQPIQTTTENSSARTPSTRSPK